MDRYEQQLRQEIEAVALGRRKFLETVSAPGMENKNVHCDPVKLRAFMRNVDDYADTLFQHLQRLQESRGYTREFKARVTELTRVVPPVEQACCVLQFVLRHFLHLEPRANYASVCVPATNEVIMQYNYKRFIESNPGYDKIVRSIQTQSPVFRGVIFNKKIRWKKTPVIDFDTREKIILGGMYLHALIEATGMFHFADVTDAEGRPSKQFAPTSDFLDWLDEAYATYAELSPMDIPMIVPPRDWTGTYSGGLLTNEARLARRPIVRSNLKEVREQAFENLGEIAIAALNVLQKQAWKINTAVLDVLVEVQRRGMTIGDAPFKPLPLRLDEAAGPPPWQLRNMSSEAFFNLARNNPKVLQILHDWKHKRAEEYRRFTADASKRARLRTQIEVAEKLRNEERFYYCYSLDWRGRVYVQQNCGLDPQGNDTAKALLLFADGKPLGERGLWWLKVHIANMFGVDKVAFSERVKWTDDNWPRLQMCAKAPLEYLDWAEADSPWQALAALIELDRALADPAFVSHLPIYQDASCSGSQHFSAMLRDPIGGAAVNLVPTPKPSDLYALVAAESAKILAQEPLGQYWLNVRGGWGRRWTKRNAMTYAYSASLYGFTEQILDEIRKAGDDLFPVPEGVDVPPMTWVFMLAQYLAVTNRRAISAVVTKASEAMLWLREVAGIIAKKGRSISWTTPTGMKITQYYKKYRSRRISLFFGDVRYSPSYAEPTNAADVVAHRNGLAPNFVHSLDASHLQMIVLSAHKRGITLSVIHDSFSTHASDVQALRDIVREEFVRMYADSNILAGLHRELSEANPDLTLPEPPPQGTLDVRKVLESEYFLS